MLVDDVGRNEDFLVIGISAGVVLGPVGVGGNQDRRKDDEGYQDHDGGEDESDE